MRAPCSSLLRPPRLRSLDPLLFLKRTTPNVVIVLDTTERMQRDAEETYFDPAVYTKNNAGWEDAIGVTSSSTATSYQRKFVRLVHADGVFPYSAGSIETVGDLSPDYASFGARARLAVARASLARAIRMNEHSVRFGLLKTRQSRPRIGPTGAEGPVRSEAAQQQAGAEFPGGGWGITTALVDVPNASLTAPVPPLVAADSAGANGAILAILSKTVGQSGALIPAGADTAAIVDAPVAQMLEDARLEVGRLIDADIRLDSACRNTVVVLVAGGADGRGASSADPV